MGSGSYVIAEWDSVQRNNRDFQLAMQQLEQKTVSKCLNDWAPKKFDVRRALSPPAGYFGRTTILPELFDDADGSAMSTWRQSLTSSGHQTLITGGNSGNTIPEDFKVAWIGLAFPNKQQHITEVKWQIGDRKFGRIDLEEMHAYKTPAIIFEDGFLIDEEESFDLYAYVQGPIPSDNTFITSLFQRVVMLGAVYFKITSKVLGSCGAQIT